jgi:hypothetical protein
MIKKLLAVIFTTALALFFSTNAFAQVSNWQKGASICPTSPTDFASESFRQSVANLAATNANFVTLIIPYYQSSANSTDLAPGWNTPTDEALVSAINYIHSLGLNVMLKMHPEISTGEWRANINPSDRAGWFSNYGSILNHYATLGQQTGVAEICIGAEIYNMTGDQRNPTNTANWRSLIGQVREQFSGSLTYSAQHSYPNEENEIEFWDLLDYAGLAAYFPLSDDIAASWESVNQQIITPLYDKWGKPIVFTEIGYRSMDNSHQEPADWWSQGPVNEEEQARNYEALFAYWNTQPHMQGIHFWEWSSNPNAGGAGDTNFTPQNKQAQEVITNWFGQSNENPTPTPTDSPNEPPSGITYPSNLIETSVSRQGTLFTIGIKLPITLANTIVDFEVYDSQNRKIYQEFLEDQDLGQDFANYELDWTTQQEGEYRLKVGIFKSDWSINYFWQDNALTFNGGSGNENPGNPDPTPTPSSPEEPTPTPTNSPGEPSPTPTDNPAPTNTPTPPQSQGELSVWWPKDGVTVSGVHPIKGMVTNMDVSQYRMFWQVDGGQLNEMFDNAQDYPHKESTIDFSSWFWRDAGPYTIAFVAQNPAGETLAQTSVQVYIAR